MADVGMKYDYKAHLSMLLDRVLMRVTDRQGHPFVNSSVDH
jgi:hypothetical protein